RTMRQMAVAIQQLSNMSAFNIHAITRTGLGPLIKILCDGKFNTFRPMLISFLNTVVKAGDSLDDEWRQLGERLGKGLLMLQQSNLNTLDDLTELISYAEYCFA